MATDGRRRREAAGGKDVGGGVRRRDWARGLLISPCDLRQDTDSSGGGDSRARAVPGTRESTDCNSLPASRPSAEANRGPLRLSPQLPQGKDRGLASLQYSQCQAHAPKHLPHALHTPATHQPHDIHRPTTPLHTHPHTPATYQPHTIHLPPHTIQTPSPCHSHAICRPPTHFMSSTHKLPAISMPSITCRVPFTHTYTLAIRVLSLSSQMRTRHPLGTPRTSQPRRDPKPLPSAKTRSPSPTAPPVTHLCRCSPPG